MNTTKPALKKCMKSMTKPVTANEAIADKEGERNVEELVIDAKAHLFFLQWDVFVGMAGAAFIALSIVCIMHHLQILFAVFLLIGLTGCTIPLGLRPFLLKQGLKKYGATLPDLLMKLNKQMEEARKEGALS